MTADYIEMLDQVAAPGDVVIIGKPPPGPDELFGIIAAAGWEPRDVCRDPAELATLEYSQVHGDCLRGILEDWAGVFIDKNATPRSGDLVNFEMSQRLADALNNDPQPDHTPCFRGKSWVKLYVRFRGMDLLLERHGAYMTTTFACCESADGTPVLHPVRQVRRHDRLLFGTENHLTRRALLTGAMAVPLALAGCNIGGAEVPELPAVTESSSHASAIVASLVASSFSSTFYSLTCNAGSTADSDPITLTVECKGAPIAIDISGQGYGSQPGGGFNCTATAAVVSCYRDGSAITGTYFDATSLVNSITSGNSIKIPVALSIADAPTPGSHTYTLHIHMAATGTAGHSCALNFDNAFMKIREYAT